MICDRDSILPTEADTRVAMQLLKPFYLHHGDVLVVLYRQDGLWGLAQVSGPPWSRDQKAAIKATLKVLNQPLL